MNTIASRSAEGVRRHYEIECALADRLRQASKTERKDLYKSLYNELFTSVPDHPQVTMPADPAALEQETMRQFRIIRPFLTPASTVLEIGAGGCHLSVELARHVHQVYALDVSDEIAGKIELPENCRLILSDGANVPVDPGSVDVAYSNQLMEHLHPDDALEQLSGIARALKPGGTYICITPNRLCGPHDVSREFDEAPRGFHLREYDNRELTALFAQAGFRQVKALLSYERIVVPWTMSMTPFRGFEALLQGAPRAVRQGLGKSLLGVKFVGVK
jgi:SAM-dependent methyltransferase